MMMKRLIALTSAIALAAAAAPALAGSSKVGAQVDTQVDTQAGGSGATTLPQTGATPDVMAPDAGTTASTSGAAGIEAALDAINGSADTTAIGGLTSVSNVRVMKLGELSAENQAELMAAVDAHKQHATGLQAAIKANPALSAKLQEQNVDMSSVVATKIEADGSVTVYTM
jgi:hypothetical protein